MNDLSKITNHDSIASHSDVQLPIAIQGSPLNLSFS